MKENDGKFICATCGSFITEVRSEIEDEQHGSSLTCPQCHIYRVQDKKLLPICPICFSNKLFFLDGEYADGYRYICGNIDCPSHKIDKITIPANDTIDIVYLLE